MIKPISSKLIFKRLLLRITTESTFVFDNKFYKQIDGFAMGGPLSVIMSNIWMCKVENDTVTPKSPEFYKRFVDDIINRRNKDEPDKIFQDMNNHHRKINLTVEKNPQKFLDTKITIKDGPQQCLQKTDKTIPTGHRKYLRNTKEML